MLTVDLSQFQDSLNEESDLSLDLFLSYNKDREINLNEDNPGKEASIFIETISKKYSTISKINCYH